MANKTLGQAKAAKKDEFYTQLPDIERELEHYEEHFKGKCVLCNCDDPRISAFFTYFSNKFKALGLSRLITTCYKNQDMALFSQNRDERAIYLDYSGESTGSTIPTVESIGVKLLEGDGDFRSKECKALLAQADIVVTNPPFSLFREYLAQLVEAGKKFLIIGNMNAITYKEVFPLIKENKLWLGVTNFNTGMYFGVPSNFVYAPTYKFDRMQNGIRVNRVPGCCWFTNLDHGRRHEPFRLVEHYTPNRYPHYDNYDAINVDKTCDIPMDWDGVMGVPITFLDKYCPEQFEIVGLDRYVEDNPHYGHRFLLNGKETYARILVRRKN